MQVEFSISNETDVKFEYIDEGVEFKRKDDTDLSYNSGIWFSIEELEELSIILPSVITLMKQQRKD